MDRQVPSLVGTRFNQGIAVAQASGIEVRYEYLHGRGGGICQVQKQPQFFVDLALDPVEQLQVLEEALQVVIAEQWPINEYELIEGWLRESRPNF